LPFHLDKNRHLQRAEVDLQLLARGLVVAATTSAPVTVTNPASDPVQTRATDNPANHAVQFSIGVEMNNGAAQVIGEPVYTVPAGKRLVIQTVSVYRSGPDVFTQACQVFIIASFNHLSTVLALPDIQPNGISFPAATLSTVFYADPAAPVTINAYRTSGLGQEFDYITITGYLVTL
jgi:hypothetical protein